MTRHHERRDTAITERVRAAARPALAALALMLAQIPVAASACGPASPAAPSTSINDYRQAMAGGHYHTALSLLARRPDSEPFVVVDRDLVMAWHQTTAKPACATSRWVAGPDALLCGMLRERARGITNADWHPQLIAAGMASGYFAYRRPLLDLLFFVPRRQDVEPPQDVEPGQADGNKPETEPL